MIEKLIKVITAETVEIFHQIVFQYRDEIFKSEHIEDVDYFLSKICGQLLHKFRYKLGEEFVDKSQIDKNNLFFKEDFE